MPVNNMDRRQLLRIAATSATTLWLPRSAWSQTRPQENPFALGVASGSPTHEGVVLWTRLVGAALLAGDKPVTVRWEIAHDPQFQRLVQHGQASASAALGHSVHVEVAGLESDRWYHYRFMLGDAISSVGRTRTFPAPGTKVERLRLAYASCQRWEHGFFSAWRHMHAENLDAELFLGDYIYDYPGAVNAVRPVDGGWVTTLEGYRARYAQYKTDPDLQAMHTACPWLLAWDDHEVQNDYSGTSAGNTGPEVASFSARRAAAYQAYYENMPLRSSVLTQALGGLTGGAEMRIYGSVAFGDLATFHLLDDRQYRDPQACSPGARPGGGPVNPADCPVWNDPQRTLLGAVQEKWLDQTFDQSRSRWNIVGQQTLFGQRDTQVGPGQVFSNDGWDGYAPARQRLVDSLQRNRLRNPVLLGGDVHANWVGHVKADYNRAASPAVGVEFCGTSITSRASGNNHLAAQLAENPHFVFADRERKGYGVAEFTPRQLTTTLRVVSDVGQADADIETLAQFVVADGHSHIEKT